MLQRLLIITLTLCSLTASAQWQQTGSKVRYVNGLGIPTKDTAAGVAADSSQILIRPADSSLYIKYKRTWVKVGAGGGGTIGGSGTINRVPKFTASTTLGNSSIVDSASAVAMTISPLGRIGVGKSNPSGVLDVKEAEIDITSYAYGLDFKNSNAGGFSRATRYYNTNFLSSTAFFGVVGSNTSGVTRSYWVIGNPATDTTGYTNTNGLHLLSSGNVGIGYTAPAAKLAVSGTTLINTNTDNGVDKLQVSGSMNVSAKATAQTLSVTSNATVGGTLNVTGISTFSSRLNAVGGGIRLGVAGVSESLSVFLGGSTDAYPLVNNAYVTSGVGWRYLGNGPASIISYESGDFIYSNSPTNSSGPETFLPSITQRMRITAAGNMGIGSYAAPAARLVVDGSALINTNTDNGVDELQVNGSISGIGFKQAYVTKTGTYTATTDDYVIDCTSGTFTVNLPALLGRTGMVLIIKNSGTGTITVDPNGAAVIDGAATYSLAVQYATIQIISDGTDWKIISKF
jgi:hypothetical protein